MEFEYKGMMICVSLDLLISVFGYFVVCFSWLWLLWYQGVDIFSFLSKFMVVLMWEWLWLTGLIHLFFRIVYVNLINVVWGICFVLNYFLGKKRWCMVSFFWISGLIHKCTLFFYLQFPMWSMVVELAWL